MKKKYLLMLGLAASALLVLGGCGKPDMPPTGGQGPQNLSGAQGGPNGQRPPMPNSDSSSSVMSETSSISSS